MSETIIVDKLMEDISVISVKENLANQSFPAHLYNTGDDKLTSSESEGDPSEVENFNVDKIHRSGSFDSINEPSEESNISSDVKKKWTSYLMLTCPPPLLVHHYHSERSSMIKPTLNPLSTGFSEEINTPRLKYSHP